MTRRLAAVPRHEDGSLITEGTVNVEQVRTIGAINLESAQYNEEMAEKIRQKLAGTTNIRWGESDAVHVFDLVKQVFSASTIMIYVQRGEPEVTDFRPFPMSSVKNGAEFYDRVIREMHKQSPEATYTVRFKEANGSERGRGYLRLPNTTYTGAAPPAPDGAPAPEGASVSPFLPVPFSPIRFDDSTLSVFVDIRERLDLVVGLLHTLTRQQQSQPQPAQPQPQPQRSRLLRRGSQAYNAKLTPDQVREIRKLDREGSVTRSELAKRHGVTSKVIHNIIFGLSYKDVPDESSSSVDPTDSTEELEASSVDSVDSIDEELDVLEASEKAIIDRIVNEVRKHPKGLRAEEICSTLNFPKRTVIKSLKKAVRDGVLRRSSGTARGTRYSTEVSK